MKILYPRDSKLTFEESVERIRNASSTLKPFDEEIIRCLDKLSKELLKKARVEPSLAPLAFFIRKAHLLELKSEFERQLPLGVVAVPQGVIFHIPPTNVDTLFLYTLSLSLLAGNSNVVRISKNAGLGTVNILNDLFRVLDEHPRISELVSFISFDRDASVLEALSQNCDVRMIWGGDETIKSITNTKTNLYAKDLSFPDRISLSCISVDAWQAATENTKQKVIGDLYNDSYWFDQMACSSPQQIILISNGDEARIDETKADIFTRLNYFASGRYESPEGQAINKMVALTKAYALGATSSQWESNSAVFVDGLSVEGTEFVRPGAGFFGIQHFEKIEDIIPQIKRKVQTLTYFGFEREDIYSFVAQVNGVGIDRIVPIGQALDFSNIWDGKNLLLEMHRLVSVS